MWDGSICEWELFNLKEFTTDKIQNINLKCLQMLMEKKGSLVRYKMDVLEEK